MSRDRDPQGRPRSARPRDAFGRPLPHDAEGVPRIPDEYAPSGPEAVVEAVRLLSEERPFHAHEVLEARWKSAPEEERELWQGLAQICVGLTHLQRDNRRGAAVLLNRGADRITPYTGRPPYGMRLAEAAGRAREVAERSGDVVPSAAVALIRETLGGGTGA
ncbi:DUF309 domain-containing protein [Streptosporangium sp. KLBMP 9127]|nr:DUF309 domain-containing protein [Streptosporangium sp. KLBMP 9127]